jgi:hypothetical protein
MELEIIMLSRISQAQKAKYNCFHSYVQSKPKMIITGHEYKRRTVCGGQRKRGGGKKKVQG